MTDWRRLLIKHGAEVASVNLDGKTPLDLAVEGDDDCAKVAELLRAEFKAQGVSLAPFHHHRPIRLPGVTDLVVAKHKHALHELLMEVVNTKVQQHQSLDGANC